MDIDHIFLCHQSTALSSFCFTTSKTDSVYCQYYAPQKKRRKVLPYVGNPLFPVATTQPGKYFPFCVIATSKVLSQLHCSNGKEETDIYVAYCNINVILLLGDKKKKVLSRSCEGRNTEESPPSSFLFPRSQMAKRRKR